MHARYGVVQSTHSNLSFSVDTIELSADAVSSAFEGDVFDVKPLSFVPDATSLTMEPLTTKDWEMLELYADFLESGSLLSQVSLVYPGQVISLLVGGEGKDIARVRVQDSTCRRLVANTEIVIVPKPRAAPPSPSPPLRLVGTADDWSDAMKALGRVTLLNVSPGSMMIHPKTLESQVPGWARCNPPAQHAVVWRADRATGPCTVVSIEVSDCIPEGAVGTYV